MKLVIGVLCVAFLLEICSCRQVAFTEDTRNPVHLNTTCIQMVGNQRINKPPILLLHGFFGFKETWFPLMQHLVFQTGRKVCASDLRNHGDSPWSDEFDSNVMAKDVEYLLEKLNFTKVVLLGHSLGGKIAVQFSLTKPDKVEKLIVEDMRPNGVRWDPEPQDNSLFKKMADAALEAIPEGATEEEARRAVYRFYANLSKKVNETFEYDEIVVKNYPIKFLNGKWVWKANMDVLEKAALNFNATIPHSHGLFNGPALFIYGGKSFFRVLDAKDEILELFPNAEFAEVKNAGHMVHMFPEYKAQVLKFIQK